MRDRFNLISISANNNWQILAELAKEFGVKQVAIANEEHYENLKDALAGAGCEVLAGSGGVIKAAADNEAEMLVSAAVGAAGLRPTVEAIKAGKDIALANKETLVMAGELVTSLVREKGIKLLPVDSEHSAIFQSMQSGTKNEIRRILITASGGPFRGKGSKELKSVTANDALAHPTWDMGRKITIDSASLVNKALEVIEAHWLFDIDYDHIDVVVHPQSVVHSMVEYIDGSVVAQLGETDMKIPIQYALTWPERAESSLTGMDITSIGTLTFEKPNFESFPCLNLGYNAGRRGGMSPAIFSSANEAAVDLFLNGKIAFTDIPVLLDRAMEGYSGSNEASLENIIKADGWAREFVYNMADEGIAV
jgi:1-deoxy-D-xylulose-5-phosphate reductoisomerase